MHAALEIVCPLCGEESLVRREPVFEGFKKVGEKRFCSSCGGELPDEASEAPPADTRPSIFQDDEPDTPDVFGDEERRRCCRYCVHYVLNPFTQRCGLHERDVEATDLCFDFEARADEDDEDGA